MERPACTTTPRSLAPAAAPNCRKLVPNGAQQALRGVVRLARSIIPVLLASVATACETQPTHEVLALTDLTPRVADAGDRLLLHTTGLPPPGDIRRITIHLTAALARPGMPRCEQLVSATLADPPEGATTLDLVTGSPRETTYAELAGHSLRIDGAGQLEFALTDDLLRTLTRCPGERDADHVGHATLSFLGSRAGIALRVETQQGTTLAAARPLRGPLLDVHAPHGRSLESSRVALADAEAALARAGLRLAPVLPPEGGLTVEHVIAGSAADRSGVADGDVLLRLDGVNLAAPDDFRPAPDRETAVLAVRRGDSVEDRPLHVGTRGPGIAWDARLAAFLVLAAAAVVEASRRKVPRVLRWAARVSGAQMPGAPEPAVLAPWSAAPMHVAGVAVATSALAVPFGSGLFAVNPDVLSVTLAVVVAGAAFAALRVVGSSARLGAALREVVRGAPVVVLAGALAASAGSLDLHAVAAAQGAMPWGWNLFRDPLHLALGAYGFAWALAGFEAASRPTLPVHLAERTLTWTRAALLSVLVAGAWRLPLTPPGVQASAAGFQMLGIGVLLAKAWVALAAARWLRRNARRPRAEALVHVAWTVAMPLALAALASGAALALWGARIPWAVRTAAATTSAALTFGWTVVSVAAAWRSRNPTLAAPTPTPT